MPVKPCTLSTSEDHFEHVQGVAIRILHVRGMIAGNKGGKPGVRPSEHDPPFPLLRRFVAAYGRWLGGSGNRAKRLLNPREKLCAVKVPNYDDHRVVRDIVRFIKILDICTGQLPQVLHPADHWVAVGIRLERGRIDLLPQRARRVVLGAQPSLLHDHAALPLDLGRVEAQVDHPIRL